MKTIEIQCKIGKLPYSERLVITGAVWYYKADGLTEAEAIRRAWSDYCNLRPLYAPNGDRNI